MVLQFSDSITWVEMVTTNLSATAIAAGENSISFDSLSSIISIAVDPFKDEIYLLTETGNVIRFNTKTLLITKLAEYTITDAVKIEYCGFGEQIYIHNNNAIYAMSRDGEYVSMIMNGKIKDFTLVPQLGMIFYATESEIKAASMDGTNDMTLFTSTSEIKFVSLKVDFPSRRVFYVARGMPETVHRVLSAKFDGSDKFKHNTIKDRLMKLPAIELFQNRLFLVDRTGNSVIFHGKKFPLKDSFVDKLIIDKVATNVVFSNKILSKSPLSPTKYSLPQGVFRFARNSAKTVEELLAQKDQVEIVYKCAAGENRQLKSTIPDCTNDCYLPKLSDDAHLSIVKQGKSLTVSCKPNFHISSDLGTMTSVSCTNNGTWSGPFQCVPVSCPRLPVFQKKFMTNVYDYSRDHQITVGSTAWIRCLKDTFYQGDWRVNL